MWRLPFEITMRRPAAVEIVDDAVELGAVQQDPTLDRFCRAGRDGGGPSGSSAPMFVMIIVLKRAVAAGSARPVVHDRGSSCPARATTGRWS